jgi:hypothetical protein
MVIELAVEGWEPLRGTIGLRGESATVAFWGWIDLMAFLSSLRASSVFAPGAD